MASVAKAQCLLLLAACLSVAWGKNSGDYLRMAPRGARKSGGGGFLQSKVSSLVGSMNVKQSLESALREALGHGHGLSEAQQKAKTQKILPMFETMPKNMYGRVSRDAMQYMVQRYFGHEHGWSIIGFDPSSTALNASESSSLSVRILEERLPTYVESVLGQRLEREGFGLIDVVTMVVVLERVIFDESTQMLEDAYYLTKQQDTSRLITRGDLSEIVFTYMLLYAFNADRQNQTDLGVTMRQVFRMWPEGWPSGIFGLAAMKVVIENRRLANPFKDNTFHSFEVAQETVSMATEGYGKWSNEEECSELKTALAEMDRDGTGRVRLVDFYAKRHVGNNWIFGETQDFLRAQGALDETSPSRGMQLIIPNYVQSYSNCIETTAFYSICCLKECDPLIGAIEREIRAPMATPARIVQLVQRIIDAKEEEPRNLTAHLIAQLEAVAEQNDGQVPLHGRLFSQWLHYAFPYECPYPQMRAETVDFVSQKTYMSRTGLPTSLTRKQVQTFIEENALTELEREEGPAIMDADAWETYGMSQWTMEEELYVGYHHQGPRTGAWIYTSRSIFGSLVNVCIVVGGFLSLRWFADTTYRARFGHGGKPGKADVCV